MLNSGATKNSKKETQTFFNELEWLVARVISQRTKYESLAG